MQINKAKFETVVREAKAKTNNNRWLAAIDKAAAGAVSGWWIITELADCVAVTTETGKTYFANGVCQCEAFKNGLPCKHRALARLIDLYNEAPVQTPAPARPAVAPRGPRITRSVERDHTGARVKVVRCDGWMI